jgi:hypothetical protein
VTGEEIKRSLVEFARKWSLYDGSERAEAQTYLNELFVCYGQDRLEVGARFEEPQAGRFLDLIWPRVCIIEMKRPSEAGRLAAHRDQALGYWSNAADPSRNLPAPRFVVICAFRCFEIWEPGAYPKAPRAEFDLVELPENLDALSFLMGRDPVFLGTQAAVTKDAVDLITGLFRGLGERRAAPPDELRDFALQCVWCMFAEDLGQLESHLFTSIIDGLIDDSRRSSADDLGQLFEWLNRDGPRPAGGLYASTRYVNGALFEHPARVHLEPDELRVLRLACEYDWRKVEPHIFGSLLEGALGPDAQHELGAHYTHEVDIQKVIKPTIVDPWTARIAEARSLREVQQLQNELLNFVVLDPACGSGNFLYLAYRELRRIEQRLHAKERDLRLAQGRRQAAQGALTAFFPLTNIKGIELHAFAVSLARVTLWMAHKLAVDELDLDEATLPLEDLSGLRVGDALRVPWPRCNVIISNPPYHGTKLMRAELGDDYMEFLNRTFKVGVKDHCVYWFRRAQDHLAPGQRAGMVATNSIAEGKNREASLDYIVGQGGVITDAVRSQPWPGAANVHVSIVDWIKAPAQMPRTFTLDEQDVVGITSELRAGARRPNPRPLEANRRTQFFGVVPGGNGFVLTDHDARPLLARAEADYSRVVQPYLVGDDISANVDQGPTRWVINFGEMSLEEAGEWPAALDLVRERVKPSRDRHKKVRERTEWWKHSRSVQGLFEAVRPLRRFLACPAQSKRIYMVWCEPDWCPSNLTSVFAFDSDYAFGVLSSSIHRRWAVARSTSLKGDPRYTVNSFVTFPWPTLATAEQRASISKAAEDLDALRRRLCAEHQFGLNQLYNSVEDGAFREIAELHGALDEGVCQAYGWPPPVAHDADDQEVRLCALNEEIRGAAVPYAGPG